MRPNFFKFSRSPLAVLAALVCASMPFLAHAGEPASSTYEFRQTVPSLVVNGGVAAVGSLSLSTGAINFGNVATHTTEKRQVLVSNEGTAGLRFTADPAVTGAAFAAGATTCASTLATGADCLTEATFSPTTVGDFSGALTFSSDLVGSPHAVSLAGTAYNPVSLMAATLPTAKLGRPYTPYNFSSLLAVSNEASPTLSEVSWSSNGTPPAGMSFNAGTATLSGTPTTLTAGAGASFTVLATYKNNQGQQVYTIKVGETVLEAVQMGLGYEHTCAVTAAGGVKCWGLDDYGQLGNDAALVSQPTPVDVAGLSSGVVSVSAGESHTCAVTVTGGVKCWGKDTVGQLGNDVSLASYPTPVDVFGLTSDVTRVSAGENHTCAVTVAGGVKCWGLDNAGQLGNDAASVNQPTPVDVLGLTSGVASVSAGQYHTCAVTTAGGVKCWGRDNYGQVGNDAPGVDQPTPVDVLGLTAGVTSVSVGQHHTCAVTTTGGVKCWGANGYGQLGNSATSTDRPTLVDVAGLTSGVASVAAGLTHTCALTTAGGVKCWGNDSYGQSGNGGGNSSGPSPKNVLGLASGVASVAAGGFHACAVTTTGGVKCWGYDGSGQLGDDVAKVNQFAPVNVAP